jgi:hypothetical protein
MTATELVLALKEYSAEVEGKHKGAMMLAAATITELVNNGKRRKGLKDPALEATHYLCQIDQDAGEARIAFFYKEKTLSYMLMDSPGLYKVASDLLRCYDRLEGIIPAEE